MGTSAAALRQHLLRSLCHDSQWTYAVLWKLGGRNRMQLKWEDGYFDKIKPQDAMKKSSQNGLLSFGSEKDARSRNTVVCPIEVAVRSMSCRSYTYREGLLGEVAFTRKHQWIFAGDCPELLAECFDEWQLQFLAGIKTILLMPVLPHGVLQLGSLDKVMEDHRVVAHVKDLSSALQHDTGLCISSKPSLDHLYFSSQFTHLKEDVFASALSGALLSPVQPKNFSSEDIFRSDFGRMVQNKLPTEHFPVFMVQDDCPLSQNVMDQVLDTDIEPSKDENQTIETAMYKDIFMDQTEEPCLLDRSTWSMRLTESDINECFSTKDEQTRDNNHRSNPVLPTKLNTYEQDSKNIMSNLYHGKNMTDHPFKDMSNQDAKYNISGKLLKFPANCELHKALGTSSLKEHDDFTWIDSPSKYGLSSSTGICQIEEPELYEDSKEPNTWFINDKETENLLDSIVANLQYVSGDNASELFGCVDSFNLSRKVQDSCITEGNTESIGFDDMVPQSYEKSRFFSMSDCLTNSPTGSSSKSTSMSFNRETTNGTTRKHYKRGCKSSSFSRQRGGSNNHKPRPRDRQLIQDRVKELRELIPNGSKCSIDGLLARTVKHMLFLQSVSTQADKLKQCEHLQVNAKTDSEMIQAHQNGASWVYQLGSQPGLCPLVVEDLDHPGQMLVEMLCEEYGLFLEIAQVISRMELTIIKGVLESRSDKLWAHFIIEVARGFHRMEILWPLIQLLQRKSTAIPTKF